MPKAKKVTSKRKTTKVETEINSQSTEGASMVPSLSISNPLQNLKNMKLKKSWIAIFLIVILLAGLAYFKKGWFIAATVNGTPITNLALQEELNNTYREQTLTQMINDQIITDEGRKNNIVITDTDVNNKIASIEASVGGAQALDGLLAQQGQTRSGLVDQVKTELIVEKLYASEATVSAAEIDAFIAQNKDQMQSTDSASQRQEAQDAITQQKLSQIFNQKFPELKQQANVQIY